ncbi:hypothetical protein, partial [Mesorhizobium sp.]|uniref:hypothetical protein n=1 Tax=Mesorhizobium sp. TaxID=1871066 RepID=UPI0025BA69E8
SLIIKFHQNRMVGPIVSSFCQIKLDAINQRPARRRGQPNCLMSYHKRFARSLTGALQLQSAFESGIE